MFKSLCCLIVFTSLWTPLANANDKIELTNLLQEFLASTEKVEMHQRFWDDELIYTSSSGNRVDKQTIIAQFDQPSPEQAATAQYHAENIDIRLLGHIAIVAFKLVAKTSEPNQQQMSVPTQYYFNTGTFIKRDNQWQAIAWQATKIEPQR